MFRILKGGTIQEGCGIFLFQGDEVKWSERRGFLREGGVIFCCFRWRLRWQEVFYISISIDGKKLPSGCCWQVFAYLIYACSLTTLDAGGAGMGDKLNRLLACLADLILFSTYKHTHTYTQSEINIHRQPLTHQHLLLERLAVINHPLFSTLLNSLPTLSPYNNAN